MSTETKFASPEIKEAKEFGEFFTDLIENHKECLAVYLADTAVLDWFGYTIKGPKNISAYLKNKAGTYSHQFANTRPTHSIGFRDAHVIKLPLKKNKNISPSAIEDNYVTPPKLKFSPVTDVQLSEKGQGDGPHNCHNLESPVKKFKLNLGVGDSSGNEVQMKYVTTEGSVEFCKKSSKKLQLVTKWNRPCKLEVAYTATNFQDCTIYLIIYQGNVKCRRNLLKEFESCEPID